MKPLTELIIAGQKLRSRLFVGTGKFASPEVMARAVDASGTELVTVALRRVDVHAPADRTLSALDFSRYRLLPNTSGARDADEAVRVAKLSRAACNTSWVKLEVTPDPNYLLPDPVETLLAAEQLVKLGFVVLPYINADPILAKRLAEVGCATVMPLAAPIGSNRGLQTRDQLRIIIEQATVPVVVDAGLGMPSLPFQRMRESLHVLRVLPRTRYPAAHLEHRSRRGRGRMPLCRRVPASASRQRRVTPCGQCRIPRVGCTGFAATIRFALDRSRHLWACGLRASSRSGN
jgi:thiazole synthase